MGANATTFVPAYVAGEVLTAANLSVTNSGIPVFATTVTRDAAFGGTGEKTLAEGQFAYIEATNTTQYYDGAAWATVGASSAKFGQIVQATYSTELAVTSTSYVTSNLSATITPTLNTSKVYIISTSSGSITTANYMYNTIFRGTVAGTNLAADAFARLYNSSGSMAINFLDSPATTSATTYTLGVKVNGGTGYQHLGGATSVLTLIEVLA
jgi:hypothetical protein